MRYVTNEQRRRRTLPLGRGQLGDFLRCLLLTYRFNARRYCQSGSDRLENQPTDRRRYASYLRLDAL